jgi:5-formyltetrahydrofolate cyclo-ligase
MEVECEPMLILARRDGKRVLFPRMLAGCSLEFALVDDAASMRIGRYGVREPDRQCRSRPLASDAIVLVPGLAFDRDGGRLGRGAGYYDRALADVDKTRRGPRLVGVGFELQIVDSVPMTSIDIRMDRIVTEAGFSPIP